MCESCKEKFYDTGIGACGVCGAATASRSFACCAACAEKLGICMVCTSLLEDDDNPNIIRGID